MLVTVLLIQVLSAYAYAQSAIDLQQQCAEDGYALSGHIGNPLSFDTHYSKKLKGCFARASFYEKQKDGTVQGTTYLYNVSNGKIIGLLIYTGSKSSECYVEQTKCKSFDEFDDLISPYLDR
jgi:hypothetical protein